MRIDLNTRAPELSEGVNSASQPAVRRSVAEGSGGHEDQATLSSSGRIASLEAHVKQLPEIRQARVNALSRLIRDGEYHVSSDQVANSMISEAMRSSRLR